MLGQSAESQSKGMRIIKVQDRIWSRAYGGFWGNSEKEYLGLWNVIWRGIQTC